MGLFGTSNDPITEQVEKATDEKNTEEDWATIMSICDKAGKTSDEAKSFSKAILKRLHNSDPHIAVQAVTLLDACIKNSGKTFHLEVATREFETEFLKLVTKGHPAVAKKLRESLKKWAENEFKSDPQLNLIPSLYSKLKMQGYDFSSDMPVKKSTPVSKDPNVVESQEEEEQILKAIELSLKETSGSPRATSTPAASSSLYPSTNLASVTLPSSSTPAKEPRKVRALYDFEAAEDNELTFNSGEIILVIDDSDPNWWKGSNHRGEGLFPSNFVTPDLSVEPEKFLYEKAKKNVQFNDSVDVKIEKEPHDVEIDEDKIDRLIHLLHEADPTNPERDTEEMLRLEREVNAMGPLIDFELERVDRKHAQLTQLSADLVEALSLYHTLMREPQFPAITKMPYGFPQASTQGFNGTIAPGAHPMMGQPMGSIPPGMERLPYMMNPSGPHSIPQQHYQPMNMSGVMPSMNSLPHTSAPMMQTPGMMPGVPGHVPQMTEDRRHDPNMLPYGMPNFNGPPGMMPPNFQPAGPVSSQTMIHPQPQQQTGTYTSSGSSHMM